MMTEKESHQFCPGERIYSVGRSGLPWRVVSGSVRLDQDIPGSESRFASLAIPGDVIGAETLIFQHYSFCATALSDCVLTPWPEGKTMPVGEALLVTFTARERRTAEVVALRCGHPIERVRRLLKLLAGNTCPSYHKLPPRSDMADITALALETVSRAVSELRRIGELKTP